MMMTVPSAGTQCSLHANYPVAISSTSKMIINFFFIQLQFFDMHHNLIGPLMLVPFSFKKVC